MSATRAGHAVDASGLIVAWLTDRLDADEEASTRVPADIEGGKYVWVVRRPGGSDYVTTTARVEVHCFAPDESAGWALAGSAHDAMREIGGKRVSGQLIDRSRCVQDPAESFWSPTVFRTVGVYELDMRVTG